jgi:hypothetical protein
MFSGSESQQQQTIECCTFPGSESQQQQTIISYMFPGSEALTSWKQRIT